MHYSVIQHPAGFRPARRNQMIELLRIVAAFAVVAFHGHAPLRDAMYSGLVAFLIMSILADVQFNWHRKRRPAELARSLLLPWAFWMLIYGVFNLRRGRLFVPEDNVSGVLTGSSAHLWYLPFMFVVLVGLNAIKGRIGVRRLFWTSLALAVALFLTGAEWRWFSLTLPMPVPQWWHAIPAVLAGVAAGLAARIRHGRLIATIVLSASLAFVAATHVPGLSLPYPIGIGAAVIAGWFGERIAPPGLDLRAASSCMMGVYLVHYLWLAAVGKMIALPSLATVTLAFAGASISVFLARRFLPSSKLVLG